MLEPFAHGGGCGLATMTRAELDALIERALGAGVSVALHAIGDRATREALDGVERLAPADRARLRPRIEHAQLVHPDDLPRFAALDVIASLQPIHAAADWRTADAHWGERSRFGYAWRTLLDAGATLAFGTDAPVERIEPLLTLYAATTRRDLQGEPPGGWYPAQRISVAQAVAAYTLGSARAEHASHRRGMLRIGMDADLVVLEPDPFSLPADALRDVRVALTMVGGRIVFHGG
jgi:predicted amidohydrolase YtcJ